MANLDIYARLKVRKPQERENFIQLKTQCTKWSMIQNEFKSLLQQVTKHKIC